MRATPILLRISVLTAATILFTAAPPVSAQIKGPGPIVDFAKQVKPLLERSCLPCHGPTKPKGGFRVDSREALLKGGESGHAAIESGNADLSLLFQYVSDSVRDLEMPPLDKREKYPALTKDEIAVVGAWIDQGADWPKGIELKAPKAAAPKSPAQKAPKPADPAKAN